ncbi:MAG TPA: L,D-transpeptidase family protein [Solirubrobacteraceae bacterium]|nr:L,D-transpeptidase family protein [Solirubrobacteraceae bacterium]
MRRAALILILFALAPICRPAPAGAAEAVTLAVTPDPVAYGAAATFSGTVTPAAAERITIFRQIATALEPVVTGTARPDGSFTLTAGIRAPGTFVAATAGARSASVTLRVRPRLDARLKGLRILGAPLRLAGRLQPAAAGTLTVTVRRVARVLAVGSGGAFRTRVSSARAGRVCAALALRPAAGFVKVTRQRCARIGTPILRIGSRGPAVRYLEERLDRRHYALRGVDATYDDDTRDAVLAFQKVEGLARDGAVGPQVWRTLRRAHTPHAAARGTHIEVDKTRQVLFEVSKGRVIAVVHVSTGATGNTPVGRWRVYRKTPGYNALGMYYSLYFLRGFAIHGYASVPPYPASHGCVRLPLWFAPGLYSRWGIGARVRVIP